MSTFKYSGNGTSKQWLGDVKGMIVTTKNTSQTVALAKTIAGWQAIINPATTAAITGTYIDLARGFESKTTAPEFTTANTGFKEKTKDSPPEFTGYAFMSWEDYRTWFAADNKEFNFTFVLENGDLMCPLTSAGLQIGFAGSMFLQYDTPKPGGDGKQKACPFDIQFSDVDQIMNYQIIKTAFERTELSALVPIGVNLEVITAYTGTPGAGAVVLKATNRVTGAPYLGFTAYTQFEVVSLSGDTGGAATAITVGAAGLATVTFLNTAANMTNDFEIQAVTIVNSHVVYLSNVLNIPV